MLAGRLKHGDIKEDAGIDLVWLLIMMVCLCLKLFVHRMILPSSKTLSERFYHFPPTVDGTELG